MKIIEMNKKTLAYIILILMYLGLWTVGFLPAILVTLALLLYWCFKTIIGID